MKLKRCVVLLAVAGFLMLYSVSAQTVNFTSNTPANNAESVLSLIIEANLINFNDLTLLKRNLNGTNATIYNASRMKIMWNFDNVSALGENSSKIVDVTRGISNITSFTGTILSSSSCKRNGCIDLNGSQNGVVTHNSVQNFNNSFTISAWVYPRDGGNGAVDDYNNILWKGNYASSGGGWSLTYRRGNDRFFFFNRYYDNSNGLFTYTDNLAAPPNQWHHIVVMGNSSGIFMFLNGVKQTNNYANNGVYPSTEDMRIGVRDAGLNTFDGRVDEVMILNASLTAAEIGELYNETYLSKTAPGNYTYFKNYTSIALGLYNYQVFGTETSSEIASEQRNVTIVSTPIVVLPKSVNFTSNTPANNSESIQSLTVEANLTNFNDLSLTKLSFNGTNVTIYNLSRTILKYNFDNVSALGENSSKIVDVARNINNVSSLTATIVSDNCKRNSCLDFNGSQGGIITHNAGLIINNSFTISAWIYPRYENTTSSYESIIWKANSFSSAGGWALKYNAYVDRAYFFYRNNSNTGEGLIFSDTGSVPRNTWSHVAVLGNSSGIYLFVNGVRQADTDPNVGIYPNADNMRLGNREGVFEMYNGRVDEVMIMNASLTYNEIQELYQSYLSKTASENYSYYRIYPSLVNGTYTYQVFATNSSTEFATDQRTIRITAPTITINYPFDHVVIQKDESNNGFVIINGTISQYPINLSIIVNGTRTDYLSTDGNIFTNITLPKGGHNLTIAVNETPNVNESVLVGVGDVIIISGQSNAVDTISGYSAPYTSPYWVWYVHTEVFPTTWNNYTWESMSDSRRWSELAYYAAAMEQQPVMMINFGVGGASITGFKPGGAYYGYGLQQISYFTHGTMKVKGLVFNQGETDMINFMTEDTYLTHLNSMITNFTTTLDVTTNETVICQTLKASTDTVTPDPVRKAQQRSWTEITNSRRGATFYEIYLGVNEVHPPSPQLIYYSKRLSWAGIEQLYDNSTYTPPEVSAVRRINSTAIRVNYTLPVEISNYTSNDSTLSYGYIVNLAGGVNATDSNVTSTVRSADNLSIVVNFNADISTATNVSICTGFTCYGKAIARGLSNDLPAIILFPTTLSLEDQTSPIVTIVSPTNGQEFSTSTVNLNVSLDESGNCNYSLNGGATNSSINTTDNLNFFETLSSVSDGNYTLNFYCADSTGNQNNTASATFSVNTSVVTETPSTTSSGYVPAWYKTVKEDKPIEETKKLTVELRPKHRIELSVNNEKHHIGLLKIGKDEITIEIASEKQEATLKVGEEKKFDLNLDRKYDLKITLNSLSSSIANLSIQYIQEAIDTENTGLGEENNETVNPTSEVSLEEKDYTYVWLVVLVVIVIVALAITTVLMKHHHKRRKLRGY